YGTRDVWGARFKPLRHRRIGAFLKADGVNHVTADLPGTHGIEHIVPSIERTHAGRTIQFMGRKYVKVAVQRLNINRLVRHSLGAVNQDGSPDTASRLNHGINRVDNTQGI